MPRRPRDLVDEGYYHLIARGNNRLFIFTVPEGFEMFAELLRRSKKKYEWKLFHYCLMSNHVHLLGQVSRGEELPKLMQYLLFEYSRWYRKSNEYVGHLWQGRYKSESIGKESYFLECGRYIERNPVRAGIAARAEDYWWSSALAHVQRRGHPLLGDFYLLEEIDDWSEYLRQEEDQEDLKLLRRHGSVGRPLGRPEFLRKILSY